MNSTVKWVLVGLAGVTTAVPAAIASGAIASRDDLETPAYAVEETFDEFEVRVYEPRLVAHVTVGGSPRRATSAGFRILADYIFGNNAARKKVPMTAPVEQQQSEKIAMTAPVDRQEQADSDEHARWIITFTMPSEYTLETIPEPNDDRVVLELIPRERHAVVRFSGAPSERAVQRRMDALANAVESAGLETAGEPPVYSRYDPPWTLPFLRRNEIALELVPSNPPDEPAQ